MCVLCVLFRISRKYLPKYILQWGTISIKIAFQISEQRCWFVAKLVYPKRIINGNFVTNESNEIFDFSFQLIINSFILPFQTELLLQISFQTILLILQIKQISSFWKNGFVSNIQCFKTNLRRKNKFFFQHLKEAPFELQFPFPRLSSFIKDIFQVFCKNYSCSHNSQRSYKQPNSNIFFAFVAI